MSVWQGVAMGGYGLPKVLLGAAMPYPSTPCGQVTPETDLWYVTYGWMDGWMDGQTDGWMNRRTDGPMD
jgi:hypothetical protein